MPWLERQDRWWKVLGSFPEKEMSNIEFSMFKY